MQQYEADHTCMVLRPRTYHQDLLSSENKENYDMHVSDMSDVELERDSDDSTNDPTFQYYSCQEATCSSESDGENNLPLSIIQLNDVCNTKRLGIIKSKREKISTCSDSKSDLDEVKKSICMKEDSNLANCDNANSKSEMDLDHVDEDEIARDQCHLKEVKNLNNTQHHSSKRQTTIKSIRMKEDLNLANCDNENSESEMDLDHVDEAGIEIDGIAVQFATQKEVNCYAICNFNSNFSN